MSRTFRSDTKFCQNFFWLIYSLKIFLNKYRIGHKIDIWLLYNHGQISRVYETWKKYLCQLMYGFCQSMFFVGNFHNLTIYFLLVLAFSIISGESFLRICLLPESTLNVEKEWESVRKCTKFWESIRKYKKSWENVLNDEKVWESACPEEKVCKILTKYTQCW